MSRVRAPSETTSSNEQRPGGAATDGARPDGGVTRVAGAVPPGRVGGRSGDAPRSPLRLQHVAERVPCTV
eukprot:9480074-Pyramimonas_sp.AAC.3